MNSRLIQTTIRASRIGFLHFSMNSVISRMGWTENHNSIEDAVDASHGKRNNTRCTKVQTALLTKRRMNACTTLLCRTLRTQPTKGMITRDYTLAFLPLSPLGILPLRGRSK